jgi:hypothetical protein
MKGLRTRLKERRDYRADPFWHDLAKELRDEPPAPVPTTGDDIDHALDTNDERGDRLEELVDGVLPYNDTGAWQRFANWDPDPAPVLGPPEPVALPAGAVRSGQDVYEGGRRCGTCGIPSVADDCARCTTEGAT